MYAPYPVLRQLDHNEAKIIALCAVAMLFNYAWFFMAVRVARRDRAFSLAPFLTLFWLAGVDAATSCRCWWPAGCRAGSIGCCCSRCRC